MRKKHMIKIKKCIAVVLVLLAATPSFSQDTLYIGCENVIPLKELDFKQLTFNIIGADTLIRESSLSIVPLENNVTLTILENGQELKKLKFLCIHPPKPAIEVRISGKKNVIEAKKISIKDSFTVRAVPDSKFAQMFPKECRYKVSDYSIEVYRNYKKINFKDRKMNDTLVILITRVKRYNFRNEVNEIDMPKRFVFTITS